MAQAQSAIGPQPTQKQAAIGLTAVFITYFSSSYFYRGSSVTAPAIAAELNGMHLYSWAIAVPALAAALATLICGKLSDMYGRRLLLMASLALYMGGSILAGISQTYTFFIFARMVACLGQGALAGLCFSVLGDLYAPAERSRWSGFLAIPAGVAAVIVPTVVGMLTDKLSWRYFFWISVALVLLSGALVAAGAPSRIRQANHKIDFTGIALLALASAATMLAFSWAGSEYPWASIQIVGLMAISLILWAGFVWVENRTDEPILDPQVFRNRIFLTAALAGFISYLGLLGVQMYVPLFLQGIQGANATLSGQIITPFNMFLSFMGIPAGLLLGRTKKYKRLYIASYALLTLATFAMVAFGNETPVWLTILVTGLAGIGLGAVPTMNTLVAQFSVPKRLLGVAVGAMYFFVFMGGAIGPSILGSAMNATYAKTLRGSLPAELSHVTGEAVLKPLTNPRILISPQAMTALQASLSSMDKEDPALLGKTVQSIRKSLEASLKMVFAIGAVSVLLSFLLIITIPEVSIDVEVKDQRQR